MSLWTAAEAEAATLGKASAPFAVSGLSLDTRTLKPGDLFVAEQLEDQHPKERSGDCAHREGYINSPYLFCHVLCLKVAFSNGESGREYLLIV